MEPDAKKTRRHAPWPKVLSAGVWGQAAPPYMQRRTHRQCQASMAFDQDHYRKWYPHVADFRVEIDKLISELGMETVLLGFDWYYPVVTFRVRR